MPTHVDQERVIGALAAEFSAVEELASSLTDEEWRAPTCLPGWDVQANVAHVIGTEAMLLGDPLPEVGVDVRALPHVRNDIGAFNEAWVVALSGSSPAEVLDALRERTGKRLDALRAMTPESWAEAGFTPAGQDSYGRFMRIRVFDCWMHEQDIRDAVDRPGHDEGPVVELVLDEMAQSMGFVVGKKAGAPRGSSVRLELAGGAGRSIDVAVAERAAVVDALPGPPTVTLRMPVLTFTRLCGGRGADPDTVTITGDHELGQRVVRNLAYTI